MGIFPKIDEHLTGVNALHEYIKRSRGVEIQILHIDYETYEMNVEKSTNYLVDNYNLEEITIHLPVGFCNIEYYLANDEKNFYNMIDKIINLSKLCKININILFHTDWTFEIHKLLTIQKIKKLLDYISNTKITILIENTIFTRETCTPLLLCEYFNNDKLKTCLDLCHVKCRSAIYKTPINEYFKTNISKDAYKYVKQIHFSDNKNNDGYIDKSTHSAAHELDENFVNDINLLRSFNLLGANMVVEINETNYSSREEEINEIKLLEKVNKLLESKDK